MRSLHAVLEGYLKDTNDALGVAVVDVETGLLVGAAHRVPYFTESFLDTVAAAAVEMFRGKAVSTVEKMLTNLRGSLVRNMIKEAQITTEATYHFMATSASLPNTLVVLITNRRADLAGSWATVRRLLTDVQPFCS